MSEYDERPDDIFQRILDNNRRLASCSRHAFAPTGEPEWHNDAYICDKCGGTIDDIARRWYERGLAHGGVRAD